MGRLDGWGMPRRVLGRRALLPAAVVALLGLTACSPGSGGSAGGSGGGGAAASVMLAVEPAGSGPISPVTPIVVTASHGALSAASVTNTSSSATVAGRLSADRTSWTSTEPLGYGKHYSVTATGAGADGKPVTVRRTVTVLTPAAQTYPSLIPAPGHADVGVGQPLVVRFDHPVTDRAAVQKAMTVTSTPAQPGAWYWMSKTEVHYRPPAYWKAGTRIALRAAVYGVDLGGGVYGQTDRTLDVRVHDSWLAKADGAAHKQWIYHQGTLVKTMSISLGDPAHPSHEGPHVVSQKSPWVIMDSSTYGVGPGQPGYYREKVLWDERISNDGEFEHAAPWSVGQQGSSNVSHGCVNMSVADATWFFTHFGLGDVVEISHSGGPRLPVWDTYGDWAVSWQQWLAGT